MKDNQRGVVGVSITAIIFVAATLASVKVHFENPFIPGFAISLTVQLLLTGIAIAVMSKEVNYKIATPKGKIIIKPVLLALVVTIVVNLVMTGIEKLMGKPIETPAALAKLKPLQVLIFVFFYASIAEEFLFRGFLLNYLRPLGKYGIQLFKRRISLPVIISALAFGAAHLVVLTTGAGDMFVVRIVIFTTLLGAIAGYYQEKYDNHAFAVLVHMTGNSLAVIASLAMVS